MKILIAGDNHGDYDIITELNTIYKDIPLKIHTGDSCFEFNEIDNLKTWETVIGNMDVINLDKFKIVETNFGNIFLTHGHFYKVNSESNLQTLLKEAKINNCKFIVYGHTHKLDIRKIEDIIIINPNSIVNPFIPQQKTYIILNVTEGKSLVNVYDINHKIINSYEF